MTRVRVESFSISLDGYGAGPDQSVEEPLGIGGEALHDWLVSTQSWQGLYGSEEGTKGVDDEFAARSHRDVGAFVMGRKMFGPVRGPWPDMDWKGRWGDDPPYHGPVFVLTHHEREPQPMEGNTTFHFVTGGIEEALDRAREAANGKDVQICGGASTIRQYLRSGLIDELHVAISPILLGGGERLFEQVDLPALGYECVQFVGAEKASHMVLQRRAQ